MSLTGVKREIEEVMCSINLADRKELLKYAMKKWATFDLTGNLDDQEFDFFNHVDGMAEDPHVMLNTVCKELQAKVVRCWGIKDDSRKPFDFYDYLDERHDPDAEEFDEFLYGEEGNLCAFDTNNCQKCGFTSQLMNSKSGDLPRDVLDDIFNCFPLDIDGKTVFDIASQNGAFLYAAYYYTCAGKIIGLAEHEFDEKLQNDIIKKFEMQKRVKVYNKKLKDCIDLLETADVVIVNKVYQREIWSLIKTHVKQGAFLITHPDIKKALDRAKSGITINGWIKEIQKTNQYLDERNVTVCYQVL